jgi:hypothetical protein
MTRYLFGLSPADFAVEVVGDELELRPGAVGNVYGSYSGSDQIVDLQTPEGNPITVVTADDSGRIGFLGPDNVLTTYIDFGHGRFALQALDITAILEAQNTSIADFQDQINGISGGQQFMYVNPLAANDTQDGRTWNKAKKTLAAAIAAGVKGDMILLGPGAHDCGSGVDMPRDKIMAVHGMVPLNQKQHASTSTVGQAVLTSTAGTRPAYYIRIPASPAPGGANVYGGSFQNFYIDGDKLADTGAAIEAHAVNYVSVIGVRGRAQTPVNTRVLVRSDRTNGDDASWWTFRECGTYSMRGPEMDGNYITIDESCAFMHTSPGVGPGVKITGGTQPKIRCDLEGWDTGVYLDGCRGPIVATTGESLTTSVYAKDCYAGDISHMSYAATGNSKIVMDGGGYSGSGAELPNFVRTPNEVQRLNNPNFILISHRAETLPLQKMAASGGLINHTLANQVNPGLEIEPQLTQDAYSMTGLTLEYWNGSAWVAWTGLAAGSDVHTLHVQDSSGITIDETHKRFRVRNTLSLVGNGGGRLIGRLIQSSGATGTITCRALDGSMVEDTAKTVVLSFSSPASRRGFWADMGLPSATFIEVEFNLGISGVQTATLRRLALLTSEVHANNFGRELRGSLTPQGNVTGARGDTYHCTGASIAADAGWYQHNGTAWIKLIGRPASGATAITGSRANPEQALANLLTELAARGIIINSTSA